MDWGFNFITQNPRRLGFLAREPNPTRPPKSIPQGGLVIFQMCVLPLKSFYGSSIIYFEIEPTMLPTEYSLSYFFATNTT